MSGHRSSVSSQGSQYSTMSRYTVDSVFSHGSNTSTSTSRTVPDTHIARFAAANLPCEFVGYGGCEQTFALEDVDNWIEHIITVHLQEKLPKTVICWFCDTWIFDYKKTGDRRANFENRMWHIRGHIVEEGLTAHNMRPDHFLNDHLQKHGLVPEQAYNTVRRYAEVPQGSWILPHDGVPPDWENRDSRGEYVVNNPLEEQRRSRKNRHKSGKSRK
ncbi:hypothetical protein EV127DRAFT_201990 [Xylaria flabelliformis]|nr:hypothetical protein EV127DRAFT_201990 [Xylaria flabelliformis]